MLSEEDIRWLYDVALQRCHFMEAGTEARSLLSERLAQIARKLEQPTLPLELLIICPRCLKQHVDEGEFAVKPHKNHACQFCGLTFQASGPVESIGVQFFRGYKAGVLFIPSKSAPTISLPALQKGMQVWYSGMKVRFKESAREFGYDTEKTFEISSVLNNSRVMLKGDDYEAVRTALLEPLS